jgi:hypothetical protein
MHLVTDIEHAFSHRRGTGLCSPTWHRPLVTDVAQAVSYRPGTAESPFRLRCFRSLYKALSPHYISPPPPPREPDLGCDLSFRTTSLEDRQPGNLGSISETHVFFHSQPLPDLLCGPPRVIKFKCVILIPELQGPGRELERPFSSATDVNKA